MPDPTDDRSTSQARERMAAVALANALEQAKASRLLAQPAIKGEREHG